jgi:hypothetical protein
MYSFAQRKDAVVYDEPLYGFYLSHTNAKEYHPGADEVIKSLENDGDKVVQMMMGPQPKPVVFFKNMTHHLLDIDRSFMKQVHNIILTRDPVEMLPSFAKEIKNPTMKDVGYEDHIELLNDLNKMDVSPIVIDSKQLLLNPPKILHELCNRLAIPMDESMLTWKAGARPEDGVWGKYWYGSLHQSTGFMKYQAKTTPFPDHLKPLLKSCLPFYHQLMKLSLE